MYLVELRPGKEELYRTGDDLAAAIRSGEVDGHSRIYHRSTSKWISITLHPQYKAITAQKPAPAPAPAPASERSPWTYLTAQAETLKSAITERVAPIDASDDASDASNPDESRPDATGGSGHSAWRRPLTFGISGLFLLFGIQLAFSGPRPSWSASAAAKPSKPAVVAAATESASSQVVSLASTSTGWDGEGDDAPKVAAAKPAPVLPKAPRLSSKPMDLAVKAPAETAVETDSKSIDGLLAGYDKAYDDARARLGSGMRVARLNQLFAPTRLTPDGGVTDTRLSLAGLANFIRVYRDQERSIEREFQDSFTSMSRDHGWSAKTAKRWYSREVGKESPELVALTDRLLGGIDSVLAVLSSEAGAYQLAEGRIHFEDIGASRQYSELRLSINAAVDSARIAGGEDSSGPMGHLLKAIGTTRLPQES